ncbi:substrate-binding domain-containing protein [Streptomyces sp. NPDC006476]|uniref:sugar ABC transporter substrate-binding protein n=1 Tax=Streptomyces sp. NPDC006476 TaxID=3157175 RepID=UPI0033B82197
MNTPRIRRTGYRRSTIILAASSSALLLTACAAIGGGDTRTSSASLYREDITVGLLLPDRDTARFEKFDYPTVKREVASLTRGKGKVDYANAETSVSKQSQQFRRMVSEKVDVILVDALDPKRIASEVQEAQDAGIPVIAYDRLAQGPISAFVSHDNELVGEEQGRAIDEALGDRASGSNVVMLNGDPADPNSAQFKMGALGELTNRVDIVQQYDVTKWSPAVAKRDMNHAIRSIGLRNIAAVYAANDGLAGAAIDALKKAGAIAIPPVTGQDANLDAVQRIVAGQQYMSVYKPFVDEATDAAKLAINKVQGRNIEFDGLTPDRVDSPTQKDIPTKLVPVIALTRNTIKQTVIADGVYTIRQICTAPYAARCVAIGLE